MAITYRIENLTKIYKGSNHKANDNLTLSIHEGEIFGLLGPNGAGKTTLVHQVSGLVRPTAGSISLFGMDVVKRPDIIPHYVAIQPQHTMALRDLYPEEALLYTAQLRGVAPTAARQQMQALMDELGLNPLRKKPLSQLSGGQRKLVSLAVTFIGDRPVQIFDEPTNDLDPAIRRVVWDKLLQLNQRGTTIILVTHNVLEAERVIQRLGIINYGHLLAEGTPGALKSQVDQRVRLELLFKAEGVEHSSLLESLGEARALTRQHWTVLCQRHIVRSAIDRVLAQIGLDRLDDFRILTPSLEDVYLQLGGGEKLD
jgi:ABC-2 type transport system ATP-binding protein